MAPYHKVLARLPAVELRQLDRRFPSRPPRPSCTCGTGPCQPPASGLHRLAASQPDGPFGQGQRGGCDQAQDAVARVDPEAVLARLLDLKFGDARELHHARRVVQMLEQGDKRAANEERERMREREGRDMRGWEGGE